jgi:hypothetical protein
MLGKFARGIGDFVKLGFVGREHTAKPQFEIPHRKETI